MKKYGNFLDLTDKEIGWFLKDLFPNIKVHNICRKAESDEVDMNQIRCTVLLQESMGEQEIHITLTEEELCSDALEFTEEHDERWLQYQFAKRKHSLFYKNPYLEKNTKLVYRSIHEASDEEIIQLIKEYLPFYCVINGMERIKKDDFEVSVRLTCFNAFPFETCTESLCVTDFCILGISSKNVLPPPYCFGIWEKYLLSKGYNQYLKENPYLATDTQKSTGIRKLPEPYCDGCIMLSENCLPVYLRFSHGKPYTRQVAEQIFNQIYQYLSELLEENRGTVEEIEKILNYGIIKMDKKEMKPIDSEGMEYDTLCRLVDQIYPVHLYFSDEKSYARQAAEQIFEQVYEYSRKLLKEDCGTVEEIENFLLNGQIKLHENVLYQLDDQTFPVYLYFSDDESYVKQAAEQIFEQIYK